MPTVQTRVLSERVSAARLEGLDAAEDLGALGGLGLDRGVEAVVGD